MLLHTVLAVLLLSKFVVAEKATISSNVPSTEAPSIPKTPLEAWQSGSLLRIMGNIINPGGDNFLYAYIYGTSNRSYVGLYFDYIQNASHPEGRIVYNCGTDAGRPDGLVEYSDGLIQFVSPGECHIGVTKLLKSVVAREGSPPPGLSVLTRYHGDDEVLAFLPTMDKSGRDADLQFFINDSKDGPVQWQRGSQWYSSPEHSTTHGIYCSQSEYLMLVDVPFAYPSNYDPWDLTGPMNPPVNLDMLTQGGLVVQLNSESRSSLTALKRVDYPLNNPSAEAFTSSDPGPTTIVDFEGFPIDSSAPGNVTEVSMFETLRCSYESEVSSLLDCSFSYTTDAAPFSRIAQFSRSACSDMIGNNVWSHMDHSQDYTMGYPKIAQADEGYYEDYCIKEFDEGKLVWSMSMTPLECRNTNLKGTDKMAFMVLRGVPNVAWYLYGTYPSAADCNSNTNWDGSIFQQVQQDCNSRDGTWVCMVQGECTIEVKPSPSSDFTWVAYVVVIIVVALVAASLLIRALCCRDGLTSAGAVLDAKPSGGVVTLSTDTQRSHKSHHFRNGSHHRTQRQSTPEMHFDMPADKVAKVVAAAKAKIHGSDDDTEEKSSPQSIGESPIPEPSGFMSSVILRHTTMRTSRSTNDLAKQAYPSRGFADSRGVPSDAFDPARRVVVKRR